MTITIIRAKQYATAGRATRFEWRWTYDYRIDDGPTCQYGTSLASLRDLIRQRWPGAQVIDSWKG